MTEYTPSICKNLDLSVCDTWILCLDLDLILKVYYIFSNILKINNNLWPKLVLFPRGEDQGSPFRLCEVSTQPHRLLSELWTISNYVLLGLGSTWSETWADSSEVQKNKTKRFFLWHPWEHEQIYVPKCNSPTQLTAKSEYGWVSPLFSIKTVTLAVYRHLF